MGGKKKLLAIPIDEHDSAASSTESSNASSPKPKSKRKRPSSTSGKTVPKSRKISAQAMLLQDLDARYSQLERMFKQTVHPQGPPDTLTVAQEVPPPETKKQQDDQAFKVDEKVLEEKIMGILQKHSKPAKTSRPRAPRPKTEQAKVVPPKVNQIESPPSQEKLVEQVQVKDAPNPQEPQEKIQSQYDMWPKQANRQVHREDDRYYQMIFSRY